MGFFDVNVNVNRNVRFTATKKWFVVTLKPGTGTESFIRKKTDESPPTVKGDWLTWRHERRRTHGDQECFICGVYYTCTSTAAVDNPLRTITPNTESVVHSVVARGHHSGVIYCMWPCLWRDSRIKVLLTYFTVTTSVIIVIDIKHAQNKRCYKSFTFLSGPVGETDKFQWLRHKHSDQLRHWGSERP